MTEKEKDSRWITDNTLDEDVEVWEDVEDTEDYDSIQQLAEDYDPLTGEPLSEEEKAKRKLEKEKADRVAKIAEEAHKSIEDDISEVEESQETHEENEYEGVNKTTPKESFEYRQSHMIRQKPSGGNKPEPTLDFAHGKASEPFERVDEGWERTKEVRDDIAYKKFPTEKLEPSGVSPEGVRHDEVPFSGKSIPAKIEGVETHKVGHEDEEARDYHPTKATAKIVRKQSSEPEMGPMKVAKFHEEGDSGVSEEKQLSAEEARANPLLAAFEPEIRQAISKKPFEEKPVQGEVPVSEFKEKSETEKEPEEVQRQPISRRLIKQPPQISESEEFERDGSREITDLTLSRKMTDLALAKSVSKKERYTDYGELKEKKEDVEEDVREQELGPFGGFKGFQAKSEKYPYPEEKKVKPEDIDKATAQLIKKYMEKMKYESYGAPHVYRFPKGEHYEYHCQPDLSDDHGQFSNFSELAKHLLAKHPEEEAHKVLKEHAKRKIDEDLKKAHKGQASDEQLNKWAEEDVQNMLSTLMDLSKKERDLQTLTGIDLRALEEFVTGKEEKPCPYCKKLGDAMTSEELKKIKRYYDDLEKYAQKKGLSWEGFSEERKKRYPGLYKGEERMFCLEKIMHLTLHSDFFMECVPDILSGDMVQWFAHCLSLDSQESLSKSSFGTNLTMMRRSWNASNRPEFLDYAFGSYLRKRQTSKDRTSQQIKTTKVLSDAFESESSE